MMNSKPGQDLWRRIQGLRIAVIGDVMLDAYIWGNSDRVSPEAPVLVLRLEREEVSLGGAGNVVRNLCGLGVNPLLHGVISRDQAGEQVRSLLESRSVSVDGLRIVEGRPTTKKTRILAQQQQVVRIDQEDTETISEDDEDWLAHQLGCAIPSVHAVIISDYQKGVCSERIIRLVLREAAETGTPVFVDSKARSYARYRGATCITPNAREAATCLGYPVVSDEEAGAAAERLSTENAIPNVLVTRGAKGMTLYTAGDLVHLPTVARQVYDVSGAGDTVIATLAAGIAVGLDWVEAAQLANEAAGVVVGKVGVEPIHRNELAYATANGVRDSHSKVMALEVARRNLALWRAQGKRVVFTNGCFDVLHAGHVALLERARDLGDALVVGLNSDASVSRLKGQGRPVNREQDRAHVLASLASVDAVILFEEDTPLELIEVVRPDILVKGTDYDIEEIVGAEFVTSYGGRVERIPLIPGVSTSAIIQRSKAVGWE